MHVEGVVHPLLDDAVPNSVDVDGRSLLISGSNMSGKTTFLRALGVNGILVSALHTACATRWQAPLLAVGASIGREDSVMEGRSYYLAEVESVRRLLREKERGRQHLFLLDELYRGTNTPERVAAAYGTLRYLDRGTDIVMVATHDLEILDLLDGSYAPYHFREEIHGGALSFDFRIRPGPASTRNAIALLQLMEYPDDVVRDALRVLASVPPPP
jgi:DNA mismatch repair ATPase MutS